MLNVRLKVLILLTITAYVHKRKHLHVALPLTDKNLAYFTEIKATLIKI